MRIHLVMAHLYSEHQVTVGMFQLLLAVLQFFGTLLLSLELSDVVHRSFKNGALVPAHVPKEHTQPQANPQLTAAQITNAVCVCSSGSCGILSLRVIRLWDHGPKFFDSIVDVEPPPSLN